MRKYTDELINTNYELMSALYYSVIFLHILHHPLQLYRRLKQLTLDFNIIETDKWYI